MKETAIFRFKVCDQGLKPLVAVEVSAASYREAVEKARQVWTDTNAVFVQISLKLITEE